MYKTDYKSSMRVFGGEVTPGYLERMKANLASAAYKVLLSAVTTQNQHDLVFVELKFSLLTEQPLCPDSTLVPEASARVLELEAKIRDLEQDRDYLKVTLAQTQELVVELRKDSNKLQKLEAADADANRDNFDGLAW